MFRNLMNPPKTPRPPMKPSNPSSMEEIVRRQALDVEKNPTVQAQPWVKNQSIKSRQSEAA